MAGVERRKTCQLNFQFGGGGVAVEVELDDGLLGGEVDAVACLVGGGEGRRAVPGDAFEARQIKAVGGEVEVGDEGTFAGSCAGIPCLEQKNIASHNRRGRSPRQS